LLFEGVLTESVKEEQLYVSFTVEGYFHYVLGEVIWNSSKHFDYHFLINLSKTNRLNGLNEGIQNCLLNDVFENKIERLVFLIDNPDFPIEICILPLAHHFLFQEKAKIKENELESPLGRIIFLLLQSPSDRDFEILRLSLKFLKNINSELVNKLYVEILKIDDHFHINQFKLLMSEALEHLPIEYFENVKLELLQSDNPEIQFELNIDKIRLLRKSNQHNLASDLIDQNNRLLEEKGISIKSITLYFFGGVASMEEIPRNPRLELQMAFAGPAVSGVVGLISVYLAGPAAAFGGAGNALAIMLWTLGIMNIILMAFNLLPAFPMDGGRLLRAWFATRMPYVKATRRAADIGKIFATLMFLLGLSSLNFMLLFVAFFVYVGASEEEKATEISVSLEGILVRNIMSAPVRSIAPEMTLEELKELMFREKHRGYPVMSGEALDGIITLTDLQKVPEALRTQTRVDQVMTRKLYLIGPEEEASTAMKMMNEMQIRRLPVIDEGRLVGIVSREDLVRAIELCREREH